MTLVLAHLGGCTLIIDKATHDLKYFYSSNTIFDVSNAEFDYDQESQALWRSMLEHTKSDVLCENCGLNEGLKVLTSRGSKN